MSGAWCLLLAGGLLRPGSFPFLPGFARCPTPDLSAAGALVAFTHGVLLS